MGNNSPLTKSNMEAIVSFLERQGRTVYNASDIVDGSSFAFVTTDEEHNVNSLVDVQLPSGEVLGGEKTLGQFERECIIMNNRWDGNIDVNLSPQWSYDKVIIMDRNESGQTLIKLHNGCHNSMDSDHDKTIRKSIAMLKESLSMDEEDMRTLVKNAIIELEEALR